MFEFDRTLSTAVDAGAAHNADAYTEPATAGGLLQPDTLQLIHRYWQAANYLTAAQIYLSDNALLREPLAAEHIKQRLLGHWGTSPGQNFIYVHLNRLINAHDLNVIYISGPGHGGPGMNALAWLEGSYSAVHPEVTEDAAGLRELVRQFSTPGGVSSHCGPHVPNSMHEGGELGYALLHAQGAAFDNPDLIVACVIGDGEAETGPLAGSWKGCHFLNPVHDGAVLPILHLNGYKISGPTVDARTSDADLSLMYRGMGYAPYFVAGDDPPLLHQQFAVTLERCYAQIRALQRSARNNGVSARPRWPMIVLRTPKGWTGPKEVDGVPVEGTFRAHQVPLANVRENAAHLRMLETWLRSYQPDRLFDNAGRLLPELATLSPKGDRRMGANPHVNGGRLLHTLDLPDFAGYALEIPGPGRVVAEAPRRFGEFLRDIIRANPENFRLFCPDETNSNRLNAVFEATTRCSLDATVALDDHVGPDGRVVEVLSEHCCEGWLEGYVLSGRHGLFSTYEAFAQVVDSMVTQHAKWITHSRQYAWRPPLASLNIFLSSHVWRSDHNGFSHQAPGFVDNALARRAEVIRVYYPPDANCLLSVMEHCLSSRNYVNIVTCGKQPELQWLSMPEAIAHCARGASVWRFASNDGGGRPDVVLACVGDVPTLETCAAAWLLRNAAPTLKVRVVNIVDLCALMAPAAHPHGMDDAAFAALFTTDAPVVFAHHGNPWAIHAMVHGRAGEARFHVRGFIDEGSTTTPFDMVVRNNISRYQLAGAALRYAARKVAGSDALSAGFEQNLHAHRAYILDHFTDPPDITQWHWTDDGSEPRGAPPPAKAQPRAGAFTDA